MSRHILQGLYCITDPRLAAHTGRRLEQMVHDAIEGGARIIQYRDKTSSPAQQAATAQRLSRLCKDHSVLFLVNDDPHLAKAVDADGVHLGQTDTGLTEARSVLGHQKIIGVSCHASLDLARNAQQAGADYVAFGRFFSSHTKPQASPAPLEILPAAKAVLDIPLAAIGGIHAGNAQSVLEAGADMLAVIHHVFGREDIRCAAEELAGLFDAPTVS